MFHSITHKSYAKLLLLVATVALLSACATAAKVDSMSMSATERYYYQPDRPLSGRITVGTVTGGKDTNPMWTSEIGGAEFSAALRDSLETARLLNSTALADFEIDAELLRVDQPMFGFTFNVNTEVLYTLRDKQSGEIVLREPIHAVGTATTGDAFAGVKRLRIATEKSAQENIKRIVDILYNFEN
jgi:hypothetical protein